MTYYSAKDTSLLIDKTADIITLQVGQHVVQMTVGEWSKMISAPVVTPRVVLPLHEPGI